MLDIKRARAGASASPRWRPPAAEVDEADERKKSEWWSPVARRHAAIAGVLLALPLFVFLFGGRWGSLKSFAPGSDGKSAGLIETTNRTLGGLLSASFQDHSCLSRYRSYLYRKPSPFPLSPHFVKRLRKYEAYHKKCGPKSKLYHQAIEELKSGRNSDQSECKYVVWFPCNGLGNRMLTLAATFLYALVTDRVLLSHVPLESEGLFCEPFPGSSWILPSDFPHNNPYELHIDKPESYVNMLKNGVIRNDNLNASAASLPPYVYLHLEQSGIRLSDNVFCDRDQLLLSKFNWMILKSDSYFVPALFLTPTFQRELAQLFPDKQVVFHHLGRYLYHPTNPVWGIITRYYEAYLARADERVGIQIRIFPEKNVTFDNMYDQVVRCIREQNLLPNIHTADDEIAPPVNSSLKAALVTSLYSGYYDKLRAMYHENPTVTGDSVAIYQPSHDEKQQTEAQGHNQQALAEIYLLSYCEKIVISAWSTFGYVAHGFAGLKPWILPRPPWDKESSDISCIRSTSVEGCLHSPPKLKCGMDTEVDPSSLVPYVRHCEDVDFGLKLYG